MNRAERRRQGKEKDKVYYLKQSEINAIKEEAVKEAVGKAFALMYYIPTMVLRDKWGFGKERLGRFADQVTDMYESYDLGYISFEDMCTTIYEETGVQLMKTAKQLEIRRNENAK